MTSNRQQDLSFSTSVVSEAKPKIWKGNGHFCAVFGCNNSQKLGYRLFRFPKNQSLCDKWIRASRRADLVGKTTDDCNNLRVCQIHFQPNDFTLAAI